MLPQYRDSKLARQFSAAFASPTPSSADSPSPLSLPEVLSNFSLPISLGDLKDTIADEVCVILHFCSLKLLAGTRKCVLIRVGGGVPPFWGVCVYSARVQSSKSRVQGTVDHPLIGTSQNCCSIQSGKESQFLTFDCEMLS